MVVHGAIGRCAADVELLPRASVAGPAQWGSLWLHLFRSTDAVASCHWCRSLGWSVAFLCDVDSPCRHGYRVVDPVSVVATVRPLLVGTRRGAARSHSLGWFSLGTIGLFTSRCSICLDQPCGGNAGPDLLGCGPWHSGTRCSAWRSHTSQECEVRPHRCHRVACSWSRSRLLCPGIRRRCSDRCRARRHPADGDGSHGCASSGTRQSRRRDDETRAGHQ